ncbi:hypothetical protein PLESTB_000191500 [Pleodorina starrii]|uniref:Uncharacterized protein n=1 Tax=Pleodorina starrii TaxID=330485 RepID=A0A9W6EY68_9CHLO|nr:hypothetical protein PLESTB_000191500 [Pleodorina starrii]
MARASSGHPQRPIAVAVVRAWNLNPGSVPRKHGAQVAYDYFRIVDLRDVPLPHRAALGGESRRLVSFSDLLPLPPRVLLPSGRCSTQIHGPGPVTGASQLTTVSQPNRNRSAAIRRPNFFLQTVEFWAAAAAAAVSAGLEELVHKRRHDSRRRTLPGFHHVLRLQARLHGSAGLGPAAATGGDSPRPSWNRVLAVGHGPPQAAATLYAIVGVTPQGQVQPLYGREVVYDIGRSYRQVGVPYQEGGLHGFESVRAAARNEPPAAFEGCALPLAVAKLRAWKLGRPAQTATQAPDKRIGLDFVRVERLLQAPQELAVTSQSIRLWREPCSGPVSPPARNHHVTVQSLSR